MNYSGFLQSLCFSPFPRAPIQHVLPNPRPDRDDQCRPQPRHCHEHSHPLQPRDAPDAAPGLLRPGQRPRCRYRGEKWPGATWKGLNLLKKNVFVPVKPLTVGWDELFSRPWGSQRKDRPWRAAEKPIWDSWHEPVQPPQQPGQPGRGVPAFLPGPSDSGLYLHESALTDESAWALPAGIIPGERGWRDVGRLSWGLCW